MIALLDALTNVALAVEALVAVVLVYRNAREVTFMRRIRPLMPADVPLFEALTTRAWQITLIGLYLLILTGLGAAGIRLAEVFPPIRAINGAVLLVLLSGPAYVGREMRRLAGERIGAAAGDPT